MDLKTVLSSAALCAVISVATVRTMAGSVTLQTSSPGTVETGHTNISGTSRAGKFVANTTTGDAITGNATTTLSGKGGSFSASGNGGVGVYGIGTHPTLNATGVRGDTESTTGIGVKGVALAPTDKNYGGFFQSMSTSGRGVYATVTATTGKTFAVYGNTSSTGGKSFYGDSYATTGLTVGGHFRARSTEGRGVYGDAYGVIGPSYGVYGTAASNSGYGLWALGRSGASGTKSFRIDHPADPESKYLLHYSAEGPEPLNIYRGTIKTDARGEAWVELPSYYAEINKDPSYQLTVIDNTDSVSFVQAKVALKIKGNRFKIRTSAPNTEVCWEVKALRNDRWVRKYGAPVEVVKEGSEKGKYLHPELYGLPDSLGMNYEPENEEAAGAPPRK